MGAGAPASTTVSSAAISTCLLPQSYAGCPSPAKRERDNGTLKLPVGRSRCRRVLLSAGRGRLLFGYPRHIGAVVLEALGALEGILCGVHHEIHLVVISLLHLHRVERHRHILLAGAQKSANADDERGSLSVLVEQHIHDLADLVVRRIIDILLVPLGHGDRILRDSAHGLRRRSRLMLLSLLGGALLLGARRSRQQRQYDCG